MHSFNASLFKFILNVTIDYMGEGYLTDGNYDSTTSRKILSLRFTEKKNPEFSTYDAVLSTF